MTVGIVTDSSSCVPPEQVADLGIRKVPLQLSIDGRTRAADQVSRDQLLDLLDGDHQLSTAAPSPGSYLDAIESADDGDGVVVVSLASQMSSAHQNARLAADMAGGDTRVVDSGTAAGGAGLVAIAAASAARSGADLDAVAATCRTASSRVRLVAAVGSLEHLARSGRVPELAGRAGDSLGVRPLFEFRDGAAHVLRPSLSADAVQDRLVRRLRDDQPTADARLHVCALHGDRPAEAAALLGRATATTPVDTCFRAPFDAAMLIHTGPDLIGIAWWWQVQAGGDDVSR